MVETETDSIASGPRLDAPPAGAKKIIGPIWERIELNDNLSNLDLKNGHFAEIAAKKITFTDVDFSYSTFVRSYFDDAIFIRCLFVGCRFVECNLRSASFSRCDFKYAALDKTIIPYRQIIENAPEWPNVKRDLMQILRANAESVGDYDAQKAFIREEMENIYAVRGCDRNRTIEKNTKDSGLGSPYASQVWRSGSTDICSDTVNGSGVQPWARLLC